LLWVATLVALLTIDLGAYLVAASRAQSLADATALAAVSTEAPSTAVRTPIVEADRVAVAGRGQLVHCDCAPGSRQVEVTVSVPVPGLMLPSLGAARVAADAAAELAPPDDLPLGPTRDRSVWSDAPG
ncbi:MAG: pilus assembly protein TadG-related protein, partial [Nitriliruptoraceae bacterium]